MTAWKNDINCGNCRLIGSDAFARDKEPGLKVQRGAGTARKLNTDCLVEAKSVDGYANVRVFDRVKLVRRTRVVL